MSQPEKCLELLDTKLWLIEYELKCNEVSTKRQAHLNEQWLSLNTLRPKLILRYKLKLSNTFN